MTAPLRVIVAEDSPLLLRGICQVLVEAEFEVTAAASDRDSLLEILDGPDHHHIDAAVIDIRMPPTFTDEGVQLLERLRHAHPHVGVLLLSMYVDPGYAIRALAAGHRGVGYLLKDRVADIDTFVDAVDRVARGGSVIDAEVVASLARRPANEQVLRGLTAREREVLALMAQGRSNRTIADDLHLTDKTVETHIGHIFTKLDLLPGDGGHRRVLAVLRWLQHTEAPTGPTRAS